ncbi:hypothetical protein FBZ93_103633 [Bradyrhizobium macuxiense]|uniref:Glycosyltransferase involved in cell wall biosynthesis n=1 Tax=Bradyrhizobium macuxiense TaxID=1755647 RepID=A0A560MDC2_9BRAD|nr:glycosyltransferase family 4 protein [Bradyrhizobium macuxiense]TWC05612.1 hypothetical protein FBZ93_103633 [Bradyrhizobium macuxiense]
MTSEFSHAKFFTSFGTIAYVDPATGALRHGPGGQVPDNLVLLLPPDPASRYCRVRYTADVAKPSEDFGFGRLGLKPLLDKNSTAAPLELIRLERGLFCLKLGNAFLSAYPGGDFGLAETCSNWELYLTSEDLGPDRFPAADYRSQSYASRDIQQYIVHPAVRVQTGVKPRKARLLAFGYPAWSHGRVYYDLSKHLYENGYILDILNWRQNHAQHFDALQSYYDCFITALDGVSVLVDTYKVPYERIIAVSHHEFDIRMLIEKKGIEVFEKFSNYAVVSDYVYCASLMAGVSRVPMVASLGVDYETFYSPIAERLDAVGYASSMATTTYGVEWKRGVLAQSAATAAGLPFKVAGSTAKQTSFHDMPEFYRSVGAIVTSSISESGPLPVLEGAAAGRLVIGTPVGHFPQKANQGGGIIAPIQADKFVSFTTATLTFYKENPSAYVEKCQSIQEAARNFDWKFSIQDWVDLIERRRL